MTQEVLERLRQKGLFSLEFFVRRNESEEQRLLWRKWKSAERINARNHKSEKREIVAATVPDIPKKSTV